MKLKFTKMQGVGNDYIYVDARRLELKNPARLARICADRHFGIGADGLVLLAKSTVADIRMRMFNADGSEGQMCGNAVRCIAKYLLDANIVAKDCVKIETNSGVKSVTRVGQDLFRVDMGQAVLSTQIPVKPLWLDGRQYTYVPVDMGNPHAVIFVDEDLTALDLASYHQALTNLAVFPDGVNLELARVITPREIQMRVWERGSGETLGCGTGACAVAAASVWQGLCAADEPLTIHLTGGKLQVTYTAEQVTLCGPAQTVFTGEMPLAEDD